MKPEKTASARFHSATFRFSLLAAAVALILRFVSLFSEFQYDEWWTLLQFAPLSVTRILTDLSLPNNHPVNTLILKALTPCFSSIPCLRLGAFLAGLALLALAVRFSAALWGKWAAAGTLWLLGLSAPIILYSTTARGYVYQLLGLLLCADALRQMVQNKTGKRNLFPEIQLLTGALLSFLSLSTGIVYLAILGGLFLWIAPSSLRRSPSVWLTAFLLGAAAALYYGMNCSAILAGTRWGTPFPTVFSRLVYFGKTLCVCGFPFFAPWLAVAIWQSRRNAFILLAGFLPLLLGACTTGGPERVYLPLTLLWAMMAAGGFTRAMDALPRFRPLLLLALFLTATALHLSFGVWEKETPAADWLEARGRVQNDNGTLIVLRSSATYPALLNDPGIASQWAAMLAGEPKRLCLVGGIPGTINGADENFAETELSLPPELSEVKGKFRHFSLTRARYPEAGECYVLLSHDPEKDKKIFSPAGKLLTLNLFFPSPGKRVFVWKCGEIPPDLYTGNRLFYQIVRTR